MIHSMRLDLVSRPEIKGVDKKKTKEGYDDGMRTIRSDRTAPTSIREHDATTESSIRRGSAVAESSIRERDATTETSIRKGGAMIEL